MKLATSSVVLMVVLFGASQASVVPAMQSDDGKFSDCMQKHQPLLNEYLTLKQETMQQTIICIQEGDKLICFTAYAPILAAINKHIAALDDKMNSCLKHGVDPETVPSQSSESKAPSNENSAVNSAASDTARSSDCMKTYKAVFADLMAVEKKGTNQFVQCMTQGGTQSVCYDKFAPMMNKFNSEISALNQKFSHCLNSAFVSSY